MSLTPLQDLVDAVHDRLRPQPSILDLVNEQYLVCAALDERGQRTKAHSIQREVSNSILKRDVEAARRQLRRARRQL